uniref:Magnesium-dependent phosphatase 1 n=1 Tax=Ciona intestinalis TaxID=7719 RepID=F6QYL2_CIOIN|nr:magnesium-dependent phosphatase 1-like [Ciona intestinalis]|eukprot:XP_002130277.1 magnesium-dependent phosphatase 1-like [Ciona intestinalis]
MESGHGPKPKLVVFDLDYTLWPFWVDTHFTPPFHKDSDGNVLDSRQAKILLYPDSKDILKQLNADGYTIAVASRTSCTAEANNLLEKFDLNKYISHKQIYPGCKKNHFSKFHATTGIKYEDMIFFDDEYRNVSDVSEKGVTCIFVEHGINWKEIKDGFNKFQRNRNRP